MPRQTQATNYSRSEKEKAEARIADLFAQLKPEPEDDECIRCGYDSGDCICDGPAQMREYSCNT